MNMIGDDHIFYVLIYVLYLIVQLCAGIHVLFTKHEEPSSALLWLLVITILQFALSGRQDTREKIQPEKEGEKKI